MKKKLLLFIFFLGSLFVHAQTEYGILIKSTMKPKNPNASSTRHTICGVTDYALTGPTGSIDQYIKRFCTDNIINLSGSEKIQYNFFYVRDIDGLFILDLELNSRGESICAKEYAIPYNKNTFSDAVLGGCVGRSNVWPIHLTQPAANNVCSDDVINLNNGWNWQYQYDATGWKPMPAQFQGKRSITFNLKDIGDYDGKSQIFFQAGYDKQFTNTVIYSIIGCSPELSEKKPEATPVKCSNTATGSATLKFKSGLKTGNKLLLNLFRANPIAPDTGFIRSIDAFENEVSANTYTWNGIEAGTYKIKYQAQSTSDTGDKVGSSAIVTDTFTIENKDPLTFWATAIQPACSTNQGAIEIRATGGTIPYYYILDNQTEIINGQTVPKKIEFSGTHQIPITTDGAHTVKIVDKFNCAEQ
ncbi:hypothetical protein [Flavobacterium sp. N502540]|uniref:hypothetical protein n=1 Tax=Flavobacterium sp. N502540 TaxID=2986838 RepID=UPI0022241B3A|nr:hypothetical protein [Flavobacterium sp. N502540]